MKKDRNCGGNYPVYPTYPMPNMMTGVLNQTMPNMVNNYPMGGYMGNGYSQGSIDQQLASLNSQVDSLERRVSTLENLIGNNANKYNNSNYQML